MFQNLKTKALTVVRKAKEAKNAVVVGSYMVLAEAHATSAASNSATKVGSFLTNILNLLPTVSRIAGVLAIIGGMWGLYKYYKSGGRDGSLPAGAAGLLVGVGLFFLSGLLRWGADATGIDTNGGMP